MDNSQLLKSLRWKRIFWVFSLSITLIFCIVVSFVSQLKNPVENYLIGVSFLLLSCLGMFFMGTLSCNFLRAKKALCIVTIWLSIYGYFLNLYIPQSGFLVIAPVLFFYTSGYLFFGELKKEINEEAEYLYDLYNIDKLGLKKL